MSSAQSTVVTDVTVVEKPDPSKAAFEAEKAKRLLAQEHLKGKKVVFCLPGQTYSRQFLISWSGLLAACINKNITPVMSQDYSSCVHFARCKTLGADVMAGVSQKPFRGQLTDYDYIFFIDSDIIFSPEDVFHLLESPHDVTAGLYAMEDRKNFATVKTLDPEYFKAHGTFEFTSIDSIEKQIGALSTKSDSEKAGERYAPVSYAGMGFMVIKPGVFEKLPYPWFASELTEMVLDDGRIIRDMSSEDVSFCTNVHKHLGKKVYVDLETRVGHLKSFII